MPSRRPARRSSSPIETPIKPTGGLTILHGVARARRLRRQARRARASPPPRPGPGVRLRDRVLRGRPRAPDRRRRRRRHPLRGPGRRPGHAGDAQRDRRARRRGPGRVRSRCSPTAASRGGTHGLMIGHVAPEAALGGPIALVEEGDKIVDRRRPQGARPRGRRGDELGAPRALDARRAPHYTSGVMAKYAALVSSARRARSRPARRLRRALATRAEPTPR